MTTKAEASSILSHATDNHSRAFDRPVAAAALTVTGNARTAVAAGASAAGNEGPVEAEERLESDASQLVGAPAPAEELAQAGLAADAGSDAIRGAEEGLAAVAAAAATGTCNLPSGHLDLLRGTLDPDNPLSLLRGNAHVWTNIFSLVDEWYSRHISREHVAYQICRPRRGTPHRRRLVFPEPTGININMMPIRLFNLSSVPEMCWKYATMIRACLMPHSQFGRTAYLTIQEGLVPVGQAQRRPGLHIESPRSIVANGGHIAKPRDRALRPASLAWGLGIWNEKLDLPVGGIFMASSVANSTRVWNALIEDSVDVTDQHGSIEHMRERLGTGKDLGANELCWFTDRTPHESLPISAPDGDPTATHVYRQFFRLVAGEIDVWYSRHNTPSPLGVQPQARISDIDKFASTSPVVA